jgi:hypothetical protein
MKNEVNTTKNVPTSVEAKVQVPNAVPNPVLEPKTEAKTETVTEVKTDPRIHFPIATPPVENSSNGPKTKVIVGKTEEQTTFIKKTMDERWNQFGGRDARGAVSAAIRWCLATGFSRGDTADLLGKRYQHVRNVAMEDLRRKADADARAAKQPVAATQQQKAVG